MSDKFNWTVHKVCEYSYEIGINVVGESSRAAINLFVLNGYNAGSIWFYDKDSNIPPDDWWDEDGRTCYGMHLNISMLHDVLELLRSRPTVDFYWGEYKRAELNAGIFTTGDFNKPTKSHFEGSMSNEQFKGDIVEVLPRCPQENIPPLE